MLSGMASISEMKSSICSPLPLLLAEAFLHFRHTFFSDVDHLSSGSPALVSNLCGHSSVAITNNYLHTTPEEHQAAVNCMSYAAMLAE